MLGKKGIVPLHGLTSNARPAKTFIVRPRDRNRKREGKIKVWSYGLAYCWISLLKSKLYVGTLKLHSAHNDARRQDKSWSQ